MQRPCAEAGTAGGVDATGPATGAVTSAGAGDTEAVGSEGGVHYYVFPQGGHRTRLYVECDDSAKDRYVGAARTEAFQETFRSLRSLPMATAWANAEVLGPCAFHAWQDAWVERCAVPGVVLIGDAAGYNDPITGQGLSIAMRDVRVLSDLLAGAPRWDGSLFDGYSEERAERMRRLRYIAAFFSEICRRGADMATARRMIAGSSLIAGTACLVAPGAVGL